MDPGARDWARGGGGRASGGPRRRAAGRRLAVAGWSWRAGRSAGALLSPSVAFPVSRGLVRLPWRDGFNETDLDPLGRLAPSHLDGSARRDREGQKVRLWMRRIRRSRMERAGDGPVRTSGPGNARGRSLASGAVRRGRWRRAVRGEGGRRVNGVRTRTLNRWRTRVQGGRATRWCRPSAGRRRGTRRRVLALADGPEEYGEARADGERRWAGPAGQSGGRPSDRTLQRRSSGSEWADGPRGGEKSGHRAFRVPPASKRRLGTGDTLQGDVIGGEESYLSRSSTPSASDGRPVGDTTDDVVRLAAGVPPGPQAEELPGPAYWNNAAVIDAWMLAR